MQVEWIEKDKNDLSPELASKRLADIATLIQNNQYYGLVDEFDRKLAFHIFKGNKLDREKLWIETPDFQFYKFFCEVSEDLNLTDRLPTFGELIIALDKSKSIPTDVKVHLALTIVHYGMRGNICGEPEPTGTEHQAGQVMTTFSRFYRVNIPLELWASFFDECVKVAALVITRKIPGPEMNNYSTALTFDKPVTKEVLPEYRELMKQNNQLVAEFRANPKLEQNMNW